MRSHLARNAYRRLLAQRGLRPAASILPNRCLCRPAAHSSPTAFRQVPRRTFFGMFQKPPREVKEPELEPGYYTLLQFRGRETENLRPPPREELLEGFRDFFKHKVRYQRRVNSTQAFCALHLFRYLISTADGANGLTMDDLRSALTALLRIPMGPVEDHLELSKELYAEIKRRLAVEQQGDEEAVAQETTSAAGFKQYIIALTQYGASSEAADLLASYWQQAGISRRDKELWVLVLRGFAKEGKEEELLKDAEAAEKAGLEYMPLFQEIMTTHYAKRNNLAETQKWFNKPLYGNYPPTAETYMEILQLSLRNKQAQKWAQSVFQELCNSNPHKGLWDVIFQWAILSLGKNAEEIKHMLDTMVRHNEKSRPHIRPDIATINCLVKAAMDKEDPFLAERFIALGGEMGLQPNYLTYILQLEYRIKANDLSGAHATFEELENVGSPNDEDLPVINKYLRALCSAKPFNAERLFNVLAVVEERRAILEPPTVVEVCMAFLKNDQQYDVIDTLSLHTFQYSLEERKTVRDALVAYCLDRANTTARVWDGYSLLRQYFPETPAADRVRLMEAFFARRRPDMACYVFGHMRGHANPSVRPATDTYVRALEGLGRSPDADGLRMVHNMLKMDAAAQPGTRVHNALMLAYAACGDPDRAVDFWREVNASAEGPSYASLEIVFAVCERLPFGDELAREIWAKIQRMDIEVPAAVYTSYCGAIAGRGAVDEVKGLIAGMEASVGAAPDVMTLGVSFNALPGQQLQADFEAWGKEKYPELWEKLRKRGCKKTAEGLKRYKVVRELKA